MLTEYTYNKFSCLRWNSKETSVNAADRYLLGSPLDEKSPPQLRLFSICTSEDDEKQLVGCDLPLDANANGSSSCKPRSANALVTFGKDFVFCANQDGSGGLYSLQSSPLKDSNGTLIDTSEFLTLNKEYKLNKQRSWTSVDAFGLLACSYSKPNSAVVAAGGDGRLHLFDLTSGKCQSMQVSKSCLNCVDCLNRNEIVCGNETGDLKLYDIRTGKVEKNLAQKLSPLHCVRRHHSNGHIVATGNDFGLLSVWDLRASNEKESLHFIQAHDAPLLELAYVAGEPNSLVTGSLDGQLLHWTFSADNKLLEVKCLYGRKGEQGICSFDLNDAGQVAFFTDLQSLNVLKI